MIEMKEDIRSMTNEKAAGPDSLPVELLKLDGPYILRHLSSVLVAVLRKDKGCFSSEWKDAKVKGLRKKKNRSDYSNYTEGSLLCHTPTHCSSKSCDPSGEAHDRMAPRGKKGKDLRAPCDRGGTGHKE